VGRITALPHGGATQQRTDQPSRGLSAPCSGGHRHAGHRDRSETDHIRFTWTTSFAPRHMPGNTAHSQTS